MTRTDRFQSRVAFTLALILAIAGMAGALRVSVAPASAQVVNSVAVSCDAPGADGQTTCVISATGADQLSVPAGGVCGTIVAASGAFDGASYVSATGDPTVYLTFANPVAAGGAATYTLTTGGVATAIGGMGIVCIEAPASEQPAAPAADLTAPVEEQTTHEEPVTDETVTEPVDDQAPAEGDGDTGDSEEDTADTGTGATGPDTGETPDSTNTTGSTDATDSTGTSTDPTGGIGDDTNVTGNGSIDEGTQDAGGEGDLEEATDEPEVVPANVIVDPDSPDDPVTDDPVTITVQVYECATDPGPVDPVTAGCAVAPAGTTFQASDDTGDLGAVSTDATGTALFTSTVGSSFIVTQTSLTSGYKVRGDGTYEVLSLDGDITITFVNVPREELGRLQLVAQLCLTGQESRTEFIVPDVSAFGTASVDDCGPNADALFTLTSSVLPGGSMVVRVDASGVWRGYIPAGDYVVTAPDGTTSEIVQVSTDYTIPVVAVTRVHQDQGTLSLQLFLCSSGTEQLIVGPTGAPGGSCGVSNGIVIVTEDGAGGASTEVRVTEFGSMDISLRPGVYWVTGPRGESTSVAVSANATSVVQVLTVAASNGGGNPGGGNPDPGNGGQPGDGTGNPIGQPSDGASGAGGDASGGDGTGIGGSQSDYGSNSVATVTQLPNTGTGTSAADYWWPVLMLLMASGLACAGYRLRPQVARRRI
jgi:hypothetical protein